MEFLPQHDRSLYSMFSWLYRSLSSFTLPCIPSMMHVPHSDKFAAFILVEMPGMLEVTGEEKLVERGSQ